MASFTLLADEEQLKQWIKWLRIYWVALLLYTGISAAIGMKVGDCEDGTPDFLFGGISVVMGVASAVQVYRFWSSTTDFTSKIILAVAIILGLLDLMDFFTDGQQLALSVLCDDNFHKDWVTTFEQSSFAFGAQLVNTFHMYGLLAISLVASVVSQALLTSFRVSPGKDGFLSLACILGNYVGLGGLSKVLDSQLDNPGISVVFRAPTAGLFENVPGMYLQTSLFSLTFTSTSDKTKMKQLLSLALSGASMLKMAVETLVVIRKNGGLLRTLMADHLFVVVAMATYSVVCFLLCIICPLRIWFSYACESHLWNLTGGCVDLNLKAAT